MTSGRPRSRARTSNAERLASEQARRRPGRLWDARPRAEPRPATAAPKRITHDDDAPDRTPARAGAAETFRRKPPAASRATSSPTHWTTEEDRQLFHYRDECDLEWEDIGKRVGGRSGPACRQRYYRLADAAVVSSAYGHPPPPLPPPLPPSSSSRWTPEQDRRSIPAYVPSRLAPVQPQPLQPSTAVAHMRATEAPGPPPPLDVRPVPARPVEPGFADSYAAVTLAQGVFRLPPIL